MLVLSREFGKKVILFNKVTQERICEITVAEASHAGQDVKLLFDQMDDTVGVYREELYWLYIGEQAALQTIISNEDLAHFSLDYDEVGRKASLIKSTTESKEVSWTQS